MWSPPGPWHDSQPTPASDACAPPPAWNPPGLPKPVVWQRRQSASPALPFAVSVSSALACGCASHVACSSRVAAPDTPRSRRRRRAVGSRSLRGTWRAASSFARSSGGSARFARFAACETRGRKLAYSKPSECSGLWQLWQRLFVGVVLHEVRRQVRAAAAVTALAAHVLESPGRAARPGSRRSCRSRPRGMSRTRLFRPRRAAPACRRRWRGWSAPRSRPRTRGRRSTPRSRCSPSCAGASGRAAPRASLSRMRTSAGSRSPDQPSVRDTIRPSASSRKVTGTPWSALYAVRMLASRSSSTGKKSRPCSFRASCTDQRAVRDRDAHQRSGASPRAARRASSSGSPAPRGSADRCAGRR